MSSLLFFRDLKQVADLCDLTAGLGVVRLNGFLSGGSTALDESLPAVTMVWQYIGQLMFNMLVLTGLVKGSDRLVHEMLGA